MSVAESPSIGMGGGVDVCIHVSTPSHSLIRQRVIRGAGVSTERLPCISSGTSSSPAKGSSVFIANNNPW